jgi:hypothetical protein
MLLCLDAGNTRLKCGLFDGKRWRMQGALDYAPSTTWWPSCRRRRRASSPATWPASRSGSASRRWPPGSDVR